MAKAKNKVKKAVVQAAGKGSRRAGDKAASKAATATASAASKSTAEGATKSRALPAKREARVETPANKEVYRRFVEEVMNGGKVDLAAEFLDPVVVFHSPLPEQQPGAAGFVASLAAMRAAFPDLHAASTHLVAEGDYVAARFQVTATHSGDFFGIRASGRRIQYEEQVIVRFAGGRIVEHWSVADGLSILQQLGGAPAS